jgi:hypothetical protein
MGFSSGFQSGYSVVSDAMKARQERELKEGLARESAQYGVTEGAYGKDLQQNIDQLQALARQERGLSGEAAQQRARAEYEPSIAALQGRPEYAQNLEQVLRLQEDAGYRAANQTGLPAGPYEQAIRELERRRDMQAPDYTIGSRAQNFGTREEAEMAAKPMRTQGLARVYREAGEVEKADELLERADRQELLGLQRASAKRTAAQEEQLDKVNKESGAWLTKRLTNEDGTLRPATMDDSIAAIQHRASGLQRAGLAEQATNALSQYTAIAARQIEMQTAERTQALGAVAAAAAQGDLGPVAAFYDKYIPDGAKVTNVKRDPKTGKVTIERVALDGEKLPPTTIGSTNELIAGLNSFRNPMSLYEFSVGEFDRNLKARQVAATEKNAETAAATAGLRGKVLNMQISGLERKEEIANQVATLTADYMKLSPADKAGEKGQAIVSSINVLNSLGSGAQVGGTGLGRPMSEADVTARAAKIVESRQINPATGKMYTYTEAMDFVRNGPQVDVLDQLLADDDLF